jgi:hypothetical protein
MSKFASVHLFQGYAALPYPLQAGPSNAQQFQGKTINQGPQAVVSIFISNIYLLWMVVWMVVAERHLRNCTSCFCFVFCFLIDYEICLTLLHISLPSPCYIKLFAVDMRINVAQLKDLLCPLGVFA